MSKEKEILKYLQDNSVELWSKIPDLAGLGYDVENDCLEIAVTKEHKRFDYEGAVPFDITLVIDEVAKESLESAKQKGKEESEKVEQAALDMKKRYPGAVNAEDLHVDQSSIAINPLSPPKDVDADKLEEFQKRHPGVKVK